MSHTDNTMAVSRSVEAEAVPITDPDFIVYLLDPEQEYNCYFVVGNPDLGSTERIGVVKKMLLAHSVVLRAELQDSKIAEKNDVKLQDVFPHTFKNLLRFVYGYDTTEGLSFEDADNLLYVAEKYMLPKLKNRLATHLMTMLDCSNICSLMNNLACYAHLELNSAITEILQTETDQVLASPLFLDLSPVGFLKILEQETLNVPELELWRSAITWAKHRAGSESGKSLRNELNDQLQHIRVCTMSNDDICLEVLPSEVLTKRELRLVSLSRKTGEVQPDLTTICNVIEEREIPMVASEILTMSLRGSLYNRYISETTFNLTTKDATIELCSLFPNYGRVSSHHCKGTISFQTGLEPPIVITFEGLYTSDGCWDIPILVNGKKMRLSSNSAYSITFTQSCSNTHQALASPRVNGFDCSHFTVDIESNSNGCSIWQVHEIDYKILTKRVKSV